MASLKIVDAVTAQGAADLQVRLTKAKKALEDTRKELLRPFLDAQTAINNAAKPVGTRIDAAVAQLKGMQTAYDDEQRRKAEEAERHRQAELARLERLRQQEQEAADRKAKEIADAAAKAEQERLAKLSAEQKAQEALLDFDDPPELPELPPEPLPKTETEQKIEKLKFAPVPVPVKAVGIMYRVTLRIKMIDVMKLPDVFVQRVAKEADIRKLYCVGWREGQPIPECSGVVFEIDKQPVSTGKEQF